ncbi:hypothetical protein ACQR1Y_08315 [Bradyrhizobium sp. HKCCYLRH3099]|uniref:hypothetical protein n=1 Tax=unclassified Bradyrhizobium TaxID=2631580 RepID=UPI003EBD0C13
MASLQLIAMMFPVFAGVGAVATVYAALRWIAPHPNRQAAGASDQHGAAGQPDMSEAVVLKKKLKRVGRISEA